jgi:ribonuclease R
MPNRGPTPGARTCATCRLSPSTRGCAGPGRCGACAHADDDPKNPGGHVIWVAIADVAHYVRPGSALDREARKRGNSTYFPDRVVPMLPDSAVGRSLFSLHAWTARLLAVRMVIGEDGTLRATASCAG